MLGPQYADYFVEIIGVHPNVITCPNNEIRHLLPTFSMTEPDGDSPSIEVVISSGNSPLFEVVILRHRVFLHVDQETQLKWVELYAEREPKMACLQKMTFRKSSDGSSRLSLDAHLIGVHLLAERRQISDGKRLLDGLRLMSKVEQRGRPEEMTKQRLTTAIKELREMGTGITEKTLALHLDKDYFTVNKALRRHRMRLE